MQFFYHEHYPYHEHISSSLMPSSSGTFSNWCVRAYTQVHLVSSRTTHDASTREASAPSDAQTDCLGHFDLPSTNSSIPTHTKVPTQNPEVSTASDKHLLKIDSKVVRSYRDGQRPVPRCYNVLFRTYADMPLFHRYWRSSSTHDSDTRPCRPAIPEA